jgi:hypothetical protein
VNAIDSTGLTSSYALPLKINAFPMITGLSNLSILKNTSESIPLTVSDNETSAVSLVISKASSYTGLVSLNNIAISGTGTSRTLTITPTTDQTGTASITITVIDGDTSVSESFDIEVYSNTSPVISQIGNQSTVINDAISIAFQLTDAEGGNIVISASSSDLSLVSGGNISFTGTNITSDGSSYTLNATPGTSETITMTVVPTNGAAGNSSITITINDNGSIGEQSFEFSVIARFSEDTNVTLPGIDEGAVIFGDYDNDSDLDILITGELNSGSSSTKLYRNTGGSFEEDTGNTLYNVDRSAASFGDYNNDGDMDIILTGFPASSRLYQNSGGNFSQDSGSTLKGVSDSSVSFGDYDNDGDLDILITGDTGSIKIATLYLNTGGSFTEDTSVSLTGVFNSTGTFGDYDNDGDLDILIAGDTGSTKLTILYRNNTPVANISPSEPTSLSAIVSGQNVQLSWSASSDPETITPAALNYNLSMGSSPGACDIMSPMSLPLSNGFRQIISKGHIQGLTRTMKIDQAGTYYWRVQAIGTSFSGSSFSNEYSFTITDVAPIPGNSGALTGSTLNPYTNEVTLNWVVASDAISLTSALEYRIYSSTSSYGDYAEAWEQFSTAISGWIPNTNTVTISNLNESTQFYFAVIVRDESNNIAAYSPLEMNIFTHATDIELPGVTYSSSAFFDYDNDGDLDIFISGDGSGYISKLLKNTGGSFSEDNGSTFDGMYHGSSAFGDYDNDGDIDILITGLNGGTKISKLYKNTGGSFTEDTGSTFTDVQDCSASFGDYDSDGDLDIIIAGDTGSELIAKVYKNTDSIFSEDSTLLGIRYCSVSFGDYDNDGDLDILMTGEANGVKTARVYKNNINTPNTLPSEPDSLTAMVTGQHIQLSWSAGSDAETISPAGLNYNLRIGSYPGGNDVLSPMALPLSSGYRLIPERGMYQNLTTTVNLPDGKYYWSVQAIDTAFALTFTHIV